MKKLIRTEKRPDIDWVSQNNSLSLCADIKTAFDMFDRDYPAGEFCLAARNTMLEFLPSDWACHVTFKSANLKNPTIFPKNKFQENLSGLKSAIAGKKYELALGQTYEFDIKGHTISFYLQKADGFWSSSPGCRNYESLTQNSIYNGLYKKAACQLLPDELRLVGIVLCDGGCRAISSKLNGPHSIRVGQILDILFHEHRHIDFVLTAGISTPQVSTFEINLFTNPYSSKKDKLLNFAELASQKLHLMSKHRDYPGSVHQDIDNTKKTGSRKKFILAG